MLEDVSKMNLSGFMIAEVRDNIDPDKEGKIKIFIPKIMYENEYNEKPYEENLSVELDTELILNADNFQDAELELEESNYIWARPLTYFEDNEPNWKYEEKFFNAGTLRVPRIGTQILVIFFNSDLQKCYYLPFSPTVEKNIIDDYNCIDKENWEDEELKPNIDIIRFYWDGMRIEADTNIHVMKLAASNGNYIKLSDAGIEIKGDVHILDKLTVDKAATFKSTVDISSLITCRSNLTVQSSAYVYDQLINNHINLTTHTHPGTGQPNKNA